MGVWQDISTAPTSGEFLAYGSYLYPGDKHVTEYIRIAERTNNPEWPFETDEGQVRDGVFSHWMSMPAPPTVDAALEGKEGE